MTDTPALVQRAYATARQIGFPVTSDDPGHGRGSACLPGAARRRIVMDDVTPCSRCPLTRRYGSRT